MTNSIDLDVALRSVRAASRRLAGLPADQSSRVLLALASALRDSTPRLLDANASDLSRMDPSDPKYDRLLLDAARIEAIAADTENVARLPTPLGEVLEERTLDNGLALTKLRVPIGVVAVIYESRPNVTVDVFALCFRSGNASVLKGSRDAHDSNLAIVEVIHSVLDTFDLPRELAWLAPPDRATTMSLLHAVDAIDLAIPRGSQGLINFVRENARIPVIETGAGIVHAYVHASADQNKARAVITNAKARRVSLCNALDTVLIDAQRLPELPAMLADLGTDHDVEVLADERAYDVLDGAYAGTLRHADDETWGTEFLDYKLSVKVVEGLDEAIGHIDQHSSRHSEVILAEDAEVIERYLTRVDAAAVYVNASTQFTDGAQFGMGAEIGISTQKLHARGPMALPELTSYKWVIRGDGQTRAA